MPLSGVWIFGPPSKAGLASLLDPKKDRQTGANRQGNKTTSIPGSSAEVDFSHKDISGCR